MVEKTKEKVDGTNSTKVFKTGWKSPPSLLQLKENLTQAQPIQQSAATKIKKWLDNLNVEGSAKINNGPNRSSVTPKLIRKQAEWRYGALSEPFLSTDDLFNVRPVTHEDREAARQNEILLAHQFTVKMDRTKFIDEYVRTSVDEGTVILRTGWEAKEATFMEDVPIVEFEENPDYGQVIEEALMLQETSPSEFISLDPEIKQAIEISNKVGRPMEPIIIGYEKKPVTKLVKNHPTVTICNYANVTIDPTCEGDISKANFVIHSYETSMADLKATGLYKNLDKIEVQNSNTLNAIHHESSQGTEHFNFQDKARKKLVVYEYWGYWDVNDDGTVLPVVICWVEGTIIRMEENPYPDKEIPFVLVQYLPVRKKIYGEPDGALLEDNQAIYGAVMRGMIDTLAKSATGQVGIRKDMLDTMNRKRFERGDDYFFNPQVDPRQGIVNHTYAELPATAMAMLEVQQLEAESLTGVKSYSQGINASSLGDVAASVRGALDAASKRELGILRRLSNGLIQVARKWIAMNSEFLEEEEVVRITNEHFVKIRRDDLAGNFDLKLSISTAEEDATKVDRLSFLLQTTGNTMHPEMMKMVLSDILDLQKMPDLAHEIRSYEPEPDPMQQKMAELDVMLKEAEVQRQMAEAQEITSRALLNEAKAAVEQARIGYIQSDTDLKNLDFLEQESGTKQARQKEIVQSQAQAQTETKLIDNEYKTRIEALKLEQRRQEREERNKDK